MSLIKVKDSPNLARDENSQAILNLDNSGYNEYLQSKNRLKKQHETLMSNTHEINILKQDMQEIKALLQQLVKSQGKE